MLPSLSSAQASLGRPALRCWTCAGPKLYSFRPFLYVLQNLFLICHQIFVRIRQGTKVELFELVCVLSHQLILFIRYLACREALRLWRLDWKRVVKAVCGFVCDIVTPLLGEFLLRE